MEVKSTEALSVACKPKYLCQEVAYDGETLRNLIFQKLYLQSNLQQTYWSWRAIYVAKSL